MSNKQIMHTWAFPQSLFCSNIK